MSSLSECYRGWDCLMNINTPFIHTWVLSKKYFTVQGSLSGNSHKQIVLISCKMASTRNSHRSLIRSKRSDIWWRALWTLLMYSKMLIAVQVSVVSPGSMAESTLAVWGPRRGSNAEGTLLRTKRFSWSISCLKQKKEENNSLIDFTTFQTIMDHLIS